MKIVQTIAAAFAWLFGTMLLFVPERFYAPTGIQLSPLVATIAQAHGATLIGLGTIDWLARNADRHGVLAVLTGNLVVQVLSVFVIVHERPERWFVQTRGPVNENVPRVVIVGQEYHPPYYGNDDGFFFAPDRRVLVDVEGWLVTLGLRRPARRGTLRGVKLPGRKVAL